MCGRYAFIPGKGFYTRFSIQNRLEQLEAAYNIAPSMRLPVITRNSPNKVSLMKWGLIPSWTKEPRTKFSTINARAETITESPVYRGAYKDRRCLVPASGFYEWKTTPEGKLPYFIHLKSQDVFSFAGLYDIWKDAEGEELYTYTIITTTPNALMEPIHNRMPVILSPADEDTWLDARSDMVTLMALLKPYDASKMEVYRVSTAVNSPKNKGSDLLTPSET